MNLTLGTNRGDRLNAVNNYTGNVIYTGDAIGGTDFVYGGAFVNDTIVASGKGTKFLYGMGGSDTYIIDINQIDSPITIIDPSGLNDNILLKGVSNVNDLSIQENTDFYYIDFGKNRSIYVKKTRDWFQPKIKLHDMNNNSRDFTVSSFSRLSIRSNGMMTSETSQAGYTLKSLRLSGQVNVKVYDQQGVLLGEYDNSGNEVQTADYGYFYPVNTGDQKYMDIDLINGDYILKVTSAGSIDYTVYDPEAKGTICYEKKGINLSDGTTLVINSNFLSSENKFALENGQTVTPITGTEYVSVQQININKNQIALKAGLSTTAAATVSPQNVVSGAVAWSIIQPDENSVVAGVATNEDGSATVTGFSAGSATLRATAQDGSGVYSEIPITITQDSAPLYSAIDVSGAAYLSGAWTQTSQVTVTAAMPNGYDELYISDGNKYLMENSITVSDPGQHDISFYAKNSSTGEITATGTVHVNIDHGSPVIEGVTQDGEYYIDRLVRVTDDGLASVMINGSTAYTAEELVNGKWFTQPGSYTITATDYCGGVTELSFVINALPDSSSLSRTDLPMIQSVRTEFESRKYELPPERRDILELDISALEQVLVPLDTSGMTEAAPTISPSGGTFTNSQTVGIGNIAAGLAAYYTLDGSTPTVSSTVYSAPFTLTASATVTAAVYDGSTGLWSSPASAIFTINTPSGGGGGGGGGTPAPSAPAAPTISPSGGTFTINGATITLPANAVAADIKVTVEKVTDTTSLPMAANNKLVSDVFELTKDKADNFDKSVTITLPFDPSKVDTAKYDLGIFWLNTETNQWVKLDNVKVDLAAGKVSGNVIHFTKFAVLATAKASETVTFKDIIGHWAQDNINQLVTLGTITGYPDATFKPDNQITRAEFATVLVKAYKLHQQGGKVFGDTANHWAKGYVATAAASGIVSGYNPTTFGPDDPITREQMAVMIVRAAKLQAASNGKSFNDSEQISSWAKSAVTAASANNIIGGYPGNTFKPKDNATRAEAVTVIIKALK